MLALLLALAGGAYAVTTSAHGLEWAVVSPAGKLVRGRGSLGSSLLRDKRGHPIPGYYKVLFDQQVTDCSYRATIGNPATGVPAVGDIGVARTTGVANAVYVRTTNLPGRGANLGFHLEVIC